MLGRAQASPGCPGLCATPALCPMASAKLSRELGQDTVEKGAVLPRPQQVLGGRQLWGDLAAAFVPAPLPRPGGRLAGRAPIPCQPGTRGTLSSSGELPWHRWVITHCRHPLPPPPCSQSLFLYPLTLWDHGQGEPPSSHSRGSLCHPASPCHPASLTRLWAGSPWGRGDGLDSPCFFCFGQARLGGHGHLPFLASVRLVNSCPASHKSSGSGCCLHFTFCGLLGSGQSG